MLIEALGPARDARLALLRLMRETLGEHARATPAEAQPRHHVMSINKDYLVGHRPAAMHCGCVCV